MKHTFAALVLLASPAAAQTLQPLTAADAPAAEIFQQTGSTAMVMVAVRNKEVHFVSFGSTRPGNGISPTPDSLLRLCSLTKIFATDLLVKLVDSHTIRLDTTMQSLFAEQVPGPEARPITLGDLATHTAGLPREVKPAQAHAAHFTFPNFDQRWAWLPGQRLKTVPGSAALYSNIGFDFLGDSLAAAAHKPYPQLLAELTTTPLGMRDTTFTPGEAQCARLLLGYKEAQRPGTCTATFQSGGSAGLYSTGADMALWLEYLVGAGPVHQNPVAQAPFLNPASLSSVKGLDHAGTPTGIGLGWMILNQPFGGAPAADTIVEKTGGGGGFTTYIAISPLEHTAVFMALTENSQPWRVNPFKEMNNVLLGLSGLPPMAADPYPAPPKPRPALKKKRHKR